MNQVELDKAMAGLKVRRDRELNDIRQREEQANHHMYQLQAELYELKRRRLSIEHEVMEVSRERESLLKEHQAINAHYNEEKFTLLSSAEGVKSEE